MGANKCCSGNELFLSILALFLSPLAVLIHDGVHQPLFINILLFLLGVLPGSLSAQAARDGYFLFARTANPVFTISPIPGVLHAWYVILGSRAFRRCVLTIVAFILPPIAVGLKAGCTQQFWINILLTILGFLPGTARRRDVWLLS